MNLIEQYNIPLLIKTLRLMGKRSKTFITLILVFNIIEAIGVPLTAYGIKGVINGVTTSDIELFWRSIALIGINIVIWAIYAPISAYGCDWASKKALWDIKSQLTDHLVALPQQYHDSKAKGESLSLVSNDMACLQQIYDWDYFQVIRTAVVGIAGLITMAVIDWTFALIVLVLGTASVYISSYYSKQLAEIGSKLQGQLSQTNVDLYQKLKAAKTIRLLGITKQNMDQLKERVGREAEIKIEGSKIKANMQGILTLMDSLSYILILIIGGVMVYFNVTDWGRVIALAGLKGTADCLFSECGMHLAQIQTNLMGVKRILEVMEQPKEKIDTAKYYFSPNVGDYDTALAFKEVEFCYDGEKKVLNNLAGELKVGALTALVGESGSGKSTLMKILLSLYQPTKGRVTFKDSASSIVTPELLRAKVAYVPQEAMLFNGSIYENISWGKDGATYEEVISAAKASGAHDFILEMPQGYNTLLIDDGKSLSGGQRQRIAIARALVKNSPILLLDEITSALDSENEKRILETIVKLKRDKAILLITHRSDVEKYADTIIRIS